VNGPYRRSAVGGALLCWHAALADTLPSASNDNGVEEIIVRADPLSTLSDHRSAAARAAGWSMDNRRLLREVPATPAADAFTQYDSASDGWLGAWQLDLRLGQTVAAHADGLRRDSQAISFPGFAAVTPESGAPRGVLPNGSIETNNYAVGLSWIGNGARHAGAFCTR